jgi:hypothetical protein
MRPAGNDFAVKESRFRSRPCRQPRGCQQTGGLVAVPVAVPALAAGPSTGWSPRPLSRFNHDARSRAESIWIGLRPRTGRTRRGALRARRNPRAADIAGRPRGDGGAARPDPLRRYVGGGWAWRHGSATRPRGPAVERRSGRPRPAGGAGSDRRGRRSRAGRAARCCACGSSGRATRSSGTTRAPTTTAAPTTRLGCGDYGSGDQKGGGECGGGLEMTRHVLSLRCCLREQRRPLVAGSAMRSANQPVFSRAGTSTEARDSTRLPARFHCCGD